MDQKISKILFSFGLILLPQIMLAQFEPAAGMPGSSALHKDSSIFTGWANRCELQTGYANCMNQGLGLAGPNDSTLATGIAEGIGVVSLGDGGKATLQFPNPITNGPGYDFAVFENSFSDDFLELAFVDVSSNGIDFVRFPAVSLTDTSQQVSTFGLINPEKINNLAGKYRFLYGTPFDLEDLNPSLHLDLQRITHVRIVDVVGCINCENFTSYDSQGNIINDPYPTPFPQGGFDLDAVGVIHFAPAQLAETKSNNTLKIFPNPQQSGGRIRILSAKEEGFEQIILSNQQGKELLHLFQTTNEITLPDLPAGIYFLSALSKSGHGIIHQSITILP